MSLLCTGSFAFSIIRCKSDHGVTLALQGCRKHFSDWNVGGGGQVCECNSVFTPEQDNNKTNVEPVHSYDAFHTRFRTGVKGIIGMHRFNICLVVVLSFIILLF